MLSGLAMESYGTGSMVAEKTVAAFNAMNNGTRNNRFTLKKHLRNRARSCSAACTNYADLTHSILITSHASGCPFCTFAFPVRKHFSDFVQDAVPSCWYGRKSPPLKAERRASLASDKILSGHPEAVDHRANHPIAPMVFGGIEASIDESQ